MCACPAENKSILMRYPIEKLNSIFTIIKQKSSERDQQSRMVRSRTRRSHFINDNSAIPNLEPILGFYFLLSFIFHFSFFIFSFILFFHF